MLKRQTIQTLTGRQKHRAVALKQFTNSKALTHLGKVGRKCRSYFICFIHGISGKTIRQTG